MLFGDETQCSQGNQDLFFFVVVHVSCFFVCWLGVCWVGSCPSIEVNPAGGRGVE